MAVRCLLRAAAIDGRWGSADLPLELELASAIEAVTILNRSTEAAGDGGDTLDGIVRMVGRTRDAV